MPDRTRGYVRRDHDGILPEDLRQADSYRRQMRQPAVTFNDAQQHSVIDILRAGQGAAGYRLHAASVDPTHVHLLMSWADVRPWDAMRRSVKQALTKSLNAHFGRRTWFGRGGSRKRVKDPSHFDHLVTNYLPSHHALFWREDIKLR